LSLLPQGGHVQGSDSPSLLQAGLRFRGTMGQGDTCAPLAGNASTATSRATTELGGFRGLGKDEDPVGRPSMVIGGEIPGAAQLAATPSVRGTLLLRSKARRSPLSASTATAKSLRP